MSTTLLQPTIFGGEDSIIVATKTGSIRIRPTFRPAPLFERLEADPSKRPVGVPSDVWARFQADARRYAQRHPKAKPLRFAIWLARKEAPRLGRPSDRPEGYSDDIWEGYRRMRNRRLAADPDAKIPSLDEWLAQSAPLRESGRAGGIAARCALRQEVRWIVVVPRREMIKDPAIEAHWARRIYAEPEIAAQYRIHLRGVQRRVA